MSKLDEDMPQFIMISQLLNDLTEHLLSGYMDINIKEICRKDIRFREWVAELSGYSCIKVTRAISMNLANAITKTYTNTIFFFSQNNQY